MSTRDDDANRSTDNGGQAPAPDARKNELSQPIGPALPNWVTPPAPARDTLSGHWCNVEPIDPARHASELYAANSLDPEGHLWTYLGVGPFKDFKLYQQWMTSSCLGDDPLFFAIRDHACGEAVGVASYLRITPNAGTIEVGNLCFSPRLQRTPAATEAMYLMMRNAFELGYRRYEWKCDSLNDPSRRAAARYGFTFEGVFRQAVIYKQRSRDTAWYSVIDKEWPTVARGFERWLAPDNFDARGAQLRSLDELRSTSI